MLSQCRSRNTVWTCNIRVSENTDIDIHFNTSCNGAAQDESCHCNLAVLHLNSDVQIIPTSHAPNRWCANGRLLCEFVSLHNQDRSWHWKGERARNPVTVRVWKVQPVWLAKRLQRKVAQLFRTFHATIWNTLHGINEKLLGKTSMEKTFSFGHCPNEGGGRTLT